MFHALTFSFCVIDYKPQASRILIMFLKDKAQVNRMGSRIIQFRQKIIHLQKKMRDHLMLSNLRKRIVSRVWDKEHKALILKLSGEKTTTPIVSKNSERFWKCFIIDCGYPRF